MKNKELQQEIKENNSRIAFLKRKVEFKSEYIQELEAGIKERNIKLQMVDSCLLIIKSSIDMIDAIINE